jgi:hypothetical protein
MGLDMYAWRVKSDNIVNDLEHKQENPEELFYWRKHHDLHGWMENLYRAKGGDKLDFNCVPVRLTLEDLDKLESAIRAKLLPETKGFFFGNNPPDEESNLRDLDFIDEARDAIESGDAVYYDSWW